MFATNVAFGENKKENIIKLRSNIIVENNGVVNDSDLLLNL